MKKFVKKNIISHIYAHFSEEEKWLVSYNPYQQHSGISKSILHYTGCFITFASTLKSCHFLAVKYFHARFSRNINLRVIFLRVARYCRESTNNIQQFLFKVGTFFQKLPVLIFCPRELSLHSLTLLTLFVFLLLSRRLMVISCVKSFISYHKIIIQYALIQLLLI